MSRAQDVLSFKHPTHFFLFTLFTSHVRRTSFVPWQQFTQLVHGFCSARHEHLPFLDFNEQHLLEEVVFSPTFKHETHFLVVLPLHAKLNPPKQHFEVSIHLLPSVLHRVAPNTFEGRSRSNKARKCNMNILASVTNSWG